MPAIIHSVEEIRGILDTWRSSGETVALVPTMGSLHEGHKALVREAATHADRCVVSIFVNPLQFGAGEDFEAYPRSLVADEEFLADTLVDLIFAPSAEVIYPEGPEEAPTLSAGGVGDTFEGASRPGHFDGVLTVVKRLFDYVSPDVAVFGLKDAQQVFVVRQMVDTLGHLSDTERVYAREISRALDEAENTSSAREALEVARGILDAAPGVVVDYVDVVDPQTFRSRADGGEGLDGRLIIAATVGGVRLIDNRLLRFGQ